MPPAALGGMMPRPIHYWLGGRPWLLPRGTQFVERKKFSSTFFKRWQVSSGQRLLVELRRARNTFIVQAPFEGKSRKTNCLAAWGTFCKRKSSQQTSDSHNPEKPPGGRFFYCRRINCVSGKQRSAFSAVRSRRQRSASPAPGDQRSAFPAFCLPRGNSAAHSPAPHLPLQAPKRSSLPTGRLLLFRISRLF